MISIRRRGSFLYAQAYSGIVAIVVFIYLIAGVLLGIAAISLLDTMVAGFIFFAGAVGLSVATWITYRSVVWMFGREARQTVDIVDEGIRESVDGREREFIPWKGVKEIELAGTLGAGASLRVKSSFSKIAVSNVDIVVTHPMSIREMHRALGHTGPLMELLIELRRLAPNAEMKMNRLARRRMAKHWIAPRQDGEARM